MNIDLKDNIDWIWMAMQGKFGWALCYTQWRTVMALVSPMFRGYVEKFLASLVPEDRAWISSLLNHRFWRILRAAITGLTAIQLPSVEAVNEAIAKRKAKTGNTDTFTKPPVP